MPDKPHIILTVRETSRTVGNWSKIRRIAQKKIYDRLKAKWTPEEALEFVPRKRPAKIAVRKNYLTEFSPIIMITRAVFHTDNAEMGRLAKRIRVASGRSARQAAEEIGIKHRTYTSLERGHGLWTQDRIDRFNEVAKGWVTNE